MTPLCHLKFLSASSRISVDFLVRYCLAYIADVTLFYSATPGQMNTSVAVQDGCYMHVA